MSHKHFALVLILFLPLACLSNETNDSIESNRSSDSIRPTGSSETVESIESNDAKASEQATPKIASEFLDDLLAIGAHYREFGHIDDMMRWAPELCRLPKGPEARISEAGSQSGHASKVYALYVKDPKAYAGYPETKYFEEPKLGAFEQVIVKEAWEPVAMEGDPEAIAERVARREFHPIQSDPETSGLTPIKREDRWWHTGDKQGLYVMYRPDFESENTDKGWVYATLTADGKTVTSAGRVQNCMQCHQKRENRLFGIPAYTGRQW